MYCILRKFNLNKLFILLLLISCNSSKYSEINNILANEYQSEFEDGFLVLISEFDCSSCVNRLNTILVEMRNENLKVAGLYQQNKKDNIFIYSDIISNFNYINWTRIQDNNIYYLISEHSSNKKGPFLIEVKDGMYIDVVSVSDK